MHRASPHASDAHTMAYDIDSQSNIKLPLLPLFRFHVYPAAVFLCLLDKYMCGVQCGGSMFYSPWPHVPLYSRFVHVGASIVYVRCRWINQRAGYSIISPSLQCAFGCAMFGRKQKAEN